MSINNFAVIVIKCDFLTIDERDKMFYMTFKDKQEIMGYLQTINQKTHNVDSFKFSVYNLNYFLNELNNDTAPLIEEYVIPVFIENYQADLPSVLMDKLSQNTESGLKSQENAVNGVEGLYEVYERTRQEVIKLIKNEGHNCVNIFGNIYSVDDNGEIQRDWETYDDTWYSECETFDTIKQFFAENSEKMRLADLVLNLNCDHITKLMRKICLWDSNQRVCNFAEIGELIKDYNGEGYNVECDIQTLHDYYVYAYTDDDTKTCHISGLTDNRDEWELFLTLDNVCDIILKDNSYYDYVMELFNEEIERERE